MGERAKSGPTFFRKTALWFRKTRGWLAMSLQYRDALGKGGRVLPSTANDFYTELKAQLSRAQKRGASYVEVNSGELHRKVGGYPGKGHRMPMCCEAMYFMRQPGDEVIMSPKRGHGASLTIRYKLPRPY
jgi:hypothetical protein